MKVKKILERNLERARKKFSIEDIDRDDMNMFGKEEQKEEAKEPLI